MSKFSFELLTTVNKNGSIGIFSSDNPQEVINILRQFLPITFVIPPTETFEKPDEYNEVAENKAEAIKYIEIVSSQGADDPTGIIIGNEPMQACKSWTDALLIISKI